MCDKEEKHQTGALNIYQPNIMNITFLSNLMYSFFLHEHD